METWLFITFLLPTTTTGVQHHSSEGWEVWECIIKRQENSVY